MFSKITESKGCSSLIKTTSRFLATEHKYDVIVIGAGPGGYIAAIKAAQLGLKTACVESRATLGGTCSNIGCIPSKALLNASHHYHDVQHNFSKWGLDVNEGGVKANLQKMLTYKQRVVNGLIKGVENLFKKNRVDWLKGHGKLIGKNEVQVGNEKYSTNNIIIATGSIPATLPDLDVDEKQIVTSTGALEFNTIPEHLVVVGAGVIGLEMGTIWSRLGSKVTFVEYLDRITPGIDNEIATQFKQTLEKQHFKFKMSTKVVSANKSSSGVTLIVQPREGGANEEIKANIVLVATGRRPYTADLGLEELGIKMNKGMIETDKYWRTNIPNIYAIGDCTAGPMLAHKAEEEGIAAAETIANKAGHVNYNAIPSVIYTWPEVATVGLSEEDCKKQSLKYKITKFPFQANSRARTNDDTEGLVKVISDNETDRILGMHIIGPNAGELIAEAVIALEYGASAEDIARTSHAHPTLSEAVKEACMDKPINY